MPDKDDAFEKMNKMMQDLGWDAYDREGNPINFVEYAQLKRLPGYARIAREDFPDGTYVSTVWIGFDPIRFIGFQEDIPQFSKPMIFETMAFGESGHDFARDRYATEAEALEGHKKMVELIRTELNTGLDK